MLALVDEYPQATAFVELKRASMRHFGREAVVDPVMQLVGRHKRRVVISHDAEMVARARSAGAHRIGWVTGSLDPQAQRTANALMPEFVFCGARRMRRDDARLWTGSWRWVLYDVNELPLAHSLLERGADIIGEFLGRVDDDG